MNKKKNGKRKKATLILRIIIISIRKKNCLGLFKHKLCFNAVLKNILMNVH